MFFYYLCSYCIYLVDNAFQLRLTALKAVAIAEVIIILVIIIFVFIKLTIYLIEF